MEFVLSWQKAFESCLTQTIGTASSVVSGQETRSRLPVSLATNFVFYCGGLKASIEL